MAERGDRVVDHHAIAFLTMCVTIGAALWIQHARALQGEEQPVH